MASTPVAKPSLSGVRIKARKGAAKAQAKHEPSVFRDQVYKYLDNTASDDFEAVANKLIQAGSTLEYLKYSDAFFEIILAGGLLQPGGAQIEDGAPLSPFTIFRAREPVDVDEMRKYVDVLNKVIRRYKYLQKPLEESSIPTLVQYTNRWPVAQREKFSVVLGLLITQNLATAATLQVLTKDHLVKDNLSLSIVSLVFKAILADWTMDQLASTLKKGGIKDIMEFMPVNKRNFTNLDTYFKEQGLGVVSEWYAKRRLAVMKEVIVSGLKELIQSEDDSDTETVVAFIKEKQQEQPISDVDLVTCIWTGLTSAIDWGTRPDQVDSVAVKETTRFAPILEPFCQSAKTQVGLINTVQVYCYDESKVMRTFPQIIKVLYNKDCISSQAIFYWYEKGAKPQGKQHFLTAAKALVAKLKEQEEEDESDEE